MKRMNKTRTKGVWEKNGYYFTRKREGSKVRWITLGNSYEKARLQFHAMKTGVPVPRRMTSRGPGGILGFGVPKSRRFWLRYSS